MAQFTLKFKMDNDAFARNKEGEVRRILMDVERLVSFGNTSGFIKDINGNMVGHWNMTKSRK